MQKAILLTLLFLAGALPARSATPLPFVIHGLGRATEPLDGLWQFHAGDDPAWASPTFDDSGWQQIHTGASWEQQGHLDYTGFAWYRRRIVLAPGAPANWDLALLLPGVEDACEIYWNGAPVGSFGKVPPHPVWFGWLMTTVNQPAGSHGNASLGPIGASFSFR
ncbi:MAG: hypothetical protein ACRD27_08685, partial [Terracidiphilus sp.]